MTNRNALRGVAPTLVPLVRDGARITVGGHLLYVGGGVLPGIVFVKSEVLFAASGRCFGFNRLTCTS